jgi:hypothetical protein
MFKISFKLFYLYNPETTLEAKTDKRKTPTGNGKG